MGKHSIGANQGVRVALVAVLFLVFLACDFNAEPVSLHAPPSVATPLPGTEIVVLDAAKMAPTIDYFGLGWFEDQSTDRCDEHLLSCSSRVFFETAPPTSVTVDISVHQSRNSAREAYNKNETDHENQGKDKPEVGETAFKVRTEYLAVMVEELYWIRHNVVGHIQVSRNGYSLTDFDIARLARGVDQQIIRTPLVIATPLKPTHAPDKTSLRNIDQNNSRVPIVIAPTLMPIPAPTKTSLEEESDYMAAILPPDSRILFFSHRDSTQHQLAERIYIMSSESGLIQLGEANEDATLSPDGSMVATSSSRAGNMDIYVTKVDGTLEQRLTTDPGFDRKPTWSPEGSEIAFISDRDGFGQSIYVVGVDGTGLKQVINHTSRIQDLSWSPANSKIVFTSLAKVEGGGEIWDLYLIDLDGTNLTRITDVDSKGGDITGEISSPAWSPDGSKLAVVYGGSSGRRIYVMNADSTGLIGLTKNQGGWKPIWSPDGNKIAFNSSDGGTGISIMDADGTGRVRLPAEGLNPTLSPDGSKIAFVSERDGNSEIYMMNADGTNQTRLTKNNAFDGYPIWFPR